jgi:pyruvate/2-oxoglutarate dehydrogenase complex dihydrolipoamide dehydrogenase (E3) component
MVAFPAIPERFIVVGGGYVGVEFAQMFATFGSRVTIVENGPHLLTREDEDVAEAITELFMRDGIIVCYSKPA